MKKNIKEEKNTMNLSDFASDPFFDSLKRQLDESLDLEDIMVSEDLIQSTLRAIEIKKETALHEDDSVSTEEKHTISIEDNELISKREENTISMEDEIRVRKERKGKNKRKIIKYIGTWGSVVAASILLCYLGGQGRLDLFMENKSASMKDSGTGASNTSSELNFDSQSIDEASTESPDEEMMDEATFTKGDSTTENDKLDNQDDLRKNYTLDDIGQENNSKDQTSLEEGKVSITAKDTLNGNADSKVEYNTSGYNQDGVPKKAYDYAVEDIKIWTDASSVNINLESKEEEKIKDIMLLMSSEYLHLTAEDPVGAMKYIICIPLTEEDVIVYFINDAEVLIKTYGKEGIVTSTSYEVDEDFDLLQAIETIID